MRTTFNEKLMRKLTRNGFEIIVAPTPSEAGDIIRSKIEEINPDTISFGDSMTLYATGIIDWLRNQNQYCFIDTFEQGIKYKELIERRRQALVCHTFMTGVNAISSSDGALHWLDMVGNRIAPIAFGPRKVFIVAGINKVVDTPEDACYRIREIAAPSNVARHEEIKTPCAITGKCSDCSSPDRICNERLILHKCLPKGRITLLLIEEEIGL